MIIRKTMKDFIRMTHNKEDYRFFDEDKHAIKIHQSTYWILFIPIYSTEEIITSSL